ncbi:arginase family protein [Arthrobacter sp. KNU40]|uniref:arginase family protein n=1 Tax=Arthrobacter sp. KNU40 TaxID=3447965 RepID=UPI003F5F1989
MTDEGLEIRDGIEAKESILTQLAAALELIREHKPSRITTLGGECAVSVAPFSELARRYGEDLAVVWIDSHPDVGTPKSQYSGFHAMAVAALIGHGDPDILALLPATVSPDHLALVGLHAWTEDDYPNAAVWGLTSFSPDVLRGSSKPLLDWLASTGCSRVAIHFDVDAVDLNEFGTGNDTGLGLGNEVGGLASSEVRRIVADIESASDVVALTIAEFYPRQAIRIQQILGGFPLLAPPRPANDINANLIHADQ